MSLAPSNEYSVLVQRLREDTSRSRVKAEFLPSPRLCGSESGTPWIQEFRELHGRRDASAIQSLVHQRELLTVAQPVVFKDSNGSFLIDTPRISAPGAFVARPQIAPLGSRQKIEYCTPLSRPRFERTTRHGYQVLVTYDQVEIDSLKLREVSERYFAMPRDMARLKLLTASITICRPRWLTSTSLTSMRARR